MTCLRLDGIEKGWGMNARVAKRIEKSNDAGTQSSSGTHHSVLARFVSRQNYRALTQLHDLVLMSAQHMIRGA